ncbi:hypothetical protein C343_05531 [Cryptococcus neoformans C23]|nr:hypothetical protein C343_05531 [Cryptococcus neoformans var. grubii C23]OXC82524.1 hypothetical protein C344_05255 [Cryptococcus neoformans var. grubii AD1-7a]OXH26491.1 hypothetical protein J005_05385 [Cryptococcus neoformans var. grubii]
MESTYAMSHLPPITSAPAKHLQQPTNNPPYSVQTGRNVHSITIGPWSIVSTKKPILNGKEIEAAEKSLNLPLPEMTFGNNSLSLVYNPATPSPLDSTAASRPTAVSPEAHISLSFKTLDALAGVATGEGWEERVGGGVLVSMAEKWGKNKSWATTDNTSLPAAGVFDVPVPSKPVKPHDWTYSTCYAGSVAGPSTFEPSSTHSLPLPLLARQDPVLDQILYYEDVPLYEDELHDNGESILNARIRVMPHSFFILARLFVRVDNVLFRIYDVRVYHAFGSDEIIREVSGMEAGYDTVKQFLEKPSDLSPFTNPNWVYGVMTQLSNLPVRAPAHRRSSSSSSRHGKPWPGLGKKVGVLKLPKAGVDEIGEGLDKVQLRFTTSTRNNSLPNTPPFPFCSSCFFRHITNDLCPFLSILRTLRGYNPRPGGGIIHLPTIRIHHHFHFTKKLKRKVGSK